MILLFTNVGDFIPRQRGKLNEGRINAKIQDFRNRGKEKERRYEIINNDRCSSAFLRFFGIGL